MDHPITVGFTCGSLSGAPPGTDWRMNGIAGEVALSTDSVRYWGTYPVTFTSGMSITLNVIVGEDPGAVWTVILP